MDSGTDFKLHSGLLITRVGKGILVNTSNEWSLHSQKDFSEDAQDILKRSTKEDPYEYWYNFEG